MRFTVELPFFCYIARFLNLFVSDLFSKCQTLLFSAFSHSMKNQGLLGQCLCFIKKSRFSLLSVISSFMNLSLQMKHVASYKFITLQKKNPNSRKLSEQKLFFFVFVVTLILLIMRQFFFSDMTAVFPFSIPTETFIH